MRRGATWTYASIVVGAAVQVGVTAVTARLLDPAVFGLVAMANAVLHFGTYFAKMGVGRALIQRSEIEDVDVRAAFTSSVVLAALAAAAMYLAAPLAASFFRTESIVPVMRWLTLTFLATGLGSTGRALMERRLHFRASGAINIVSYAVGYGVPALILAARGFGVWSLVAGAIGQQVVAAALIYAYTRHPVLPTFDLRVHRRLLRFGASVSGISVLEYIGTAVDSLVIGRYGTAAQLGLYNRAVTLASLPMSRINAGLAKVLFPVLSAGRADREGFRDALARVATIAGKLVLPIGVGMSVAAPELVGVVLGSQWTDAVPVLAILAVALAIDVLATFPGIALESLDALRGKAIAQALYVLVLLGAMLVVVATRPFELVPVAVTIGVAHVVRSAAYFGLAVRAGALRAADLARMIVVLVGSSVATAIAIGVVSTVLRRASAPQEATLAAAIATGGLVVLATFWGDVVEWRSSRARP